MNSATDPHVFYEFGEFRLDASRRLLYSQDGSGPIAVKPKVLEALLYFVRHPGELLDKDRLLGELWPGLVVEENGLAQLVSALRRVLGEAPGQNRYLVTVPGRGYRFVADVLQVTDRPSGHPDPDAIEVVLAGTEPAVVHANLDRQEPVDRAAAMNRPRSTRRAAFALFALAAALVITFGNDKIARWWTERNSASPDAASRRAASTLSAGTVAVLPFENLSADPDNTYVAFGLAESVLHRLAAIHGLTLIARTSSFAVGASPADVRDIGRRLNARYVVEGSAQRSGDRLRVTAQLIDTTTGGHLWSLRFDRNIDDIFAVEDEIASNIAMALEVTLNNAKHPYAAFGTDAYLEYLQGRALLATNRIDDAEHAIDHFSRAIQLAPPFAAAYAALATAHWQAALLEQTNGTGFMYMIRTDRQRELLADGMQTARPVLDQALELDGSLAEAYILRADLEASEGHKVEAEADYRKGIALNPSDSAGHERYSSLLWHLEGREADALAEIDEAIHVDPLAPRNYYLRGVMHHYNETSGVFTEAEANFQKALALKPDYHPALVRLGMIRWEQGRFAEAVMLGERALAIDPRAEWIRWPLLQFYVELGEVDAARDVLLEAPEAVPAADWLALCLYERQPVRAAELLRADPAFRMMIDVDIRPYVLRDAALASGRLAEGRRELLGLSTQGEAITQPHTLVALAQLNLALGNPGESRRLAQQVSATSEDREIIGYRRAFPEAAALALLARNEEALALLEEGFRRGYLKRWWYAYQRDPAFDSLRNAPRFKALLARAEAHADVERDALRRMREHGQVPERVRPAKQTGRC